MAPDNFMLPENLIDAKVRKIILKTIGTAHSFTYINDRNMNIMEMIRVIEIQ